MLGDWELEFNLNYLHWEACRCWGFENGKFYFEYFKKLMYAETFCVLYN
jgi:hypothetical protein